MTNVLIEPDELATMIASERPPVLADVRWVLGGPPGRPAYEAGHLPGAQYVDLETELSGPPGAGGRHPLPDPAVFERSMRRIGVSTGSVVIAYDAATSQAAARLWWLLTDAGHARVRVLNGGLAAWQAGARPIETGPPPAVESGDLVVRPGRRRQRSGADIAGTLGGATAPSWSTYARPSGTPGSTSRSTPSPVTFPVPSTCPPRTTSTPTAASLPPTMLAERFAGIGLRSDAVFYCGSGVTAAHGLLALEVIGRSAALYPGSWSEWITDPARPVARS